MKMKKVKAVGPSLASTTWKDMPISRKLILINGWTSFIIFANCITIFVSLQSIGTAN